MSGDASTGGRGMSEDRKSERRCPTCGTELTLVSTRRRGTRALWCWKCERFLRPGEARKARGAESQLPDRNLRVDYGEARPGSSNPMPAERREEYESRIRNSVRAQAAGARQAGQLFIGGDA